VFTYTNKIVPIITVPVPIRIGRLNISKFRLNRKARPNRKTGEIEIKGCTTLAGAIPSAIKRMRLAVLLKRPAREKKPIAGPFMLVRAAALRGLNRDALNARVAAMNEIKAPASGETEPLSPTLIKIGVTPHAAPAPNPKRYALCGIFDNRAWPLRNISGFNPAIEIPNIIRRTPRIKFQVSGSLSKATPRIAAISTLLLRRMVAIFAPTSFMHL